MSNICSNFWTLLNQCAVTGKASNPIAYNNQGTIESIPTTSLSGYPKHSHHALIAGMLGGYFVWGNYSSISYQIVLYLTSRVLVGMSKRLLLQQHIEKPSRQQQTTTREENFTNISSQALQDRLYSFGAATVWGIVMYLFEDSPECLHPSLKSSMDEIYRFRSTPGSG
jgi:peroxisomal membrane protein 4